MVHGREAEELRKGIEKILADYPEEPEDGRYTYYDHREALRRLLDEVDARDSLAFSEKKT